MNDTNKLVPSPLYHIGSEALTYYKPAFSKAFVLSSCLLGVGQLQTAVATARQRLRLLHALLKVTILLFGPNP